MCYKIEYGSKFADKFKMTTTIGENHESNNAL